MNNFIKNYILTPALAVGLTTGVSLNSYSQSNVPKNVPVVTSSSSSKDDSSKKNKNKDLEFTVSGNQLSGKKGDVDRPGTMTFLKKYLVNKLGVNSFEPYAVGTRFSKDVFFNDSISSDSLEKIINLPRNDLDNLVHSFPFDTLDQTISTAYFYAMEGSIYFQFADKKNPTKVNFKSNDRIFNDMYRLGRALQIAPNSITCDAGSGCGDSDTSKLADNEILNPANNYTIMNLLAGEDGIENHDFEMTEADKDLYKLILGNNVSNYDNLKILSADIKLDVDKTGNLLGMLVTPKIVYMLEKEDEFYSVLDRTSNDTRKEFVKHIVELFPQYGRDGLNQEEDIKCPFQDEDKSKDKKQAKKGIDFGPVVQYNMSEFSFGGQTTFDLGKHFFGLVGVMPNKISTEELTLLKNTKPSTTQGIYKSDFNTLEQNSTDHYSALRLGAGVYITPKLGLFAFTDLGMNTSQVQGIEVQDDYKLENGEFVNLVRNKPTGFEYQNEPKTQLGFYSVGAGLKFKTNIGLNFTLFAGSTLNNKFNSSIPQDTFFGFSAAYQLNYNNDN